MHITWPGLINAVTDFCRFHFYDWKYEHHILFPVFFSFSLRLRASACQWLLNSNCLIIWSSRLCSFRSNRADVIVVASLHLGLDGGGEIRVCSPHTLCFLFSMLAVRPDHNQTCTGGAARRRVEPLVNPWLKSEQKRRFRGQSRGDTEARRRLLIIC